jgi:hypothetical protein
MILNNATVVSTPCRVGPHWLTDQITGAWRIEYRYWSQQ